ncbi:SDR family oxidoreductase [Iodobacter fluviatilis]|uniref:General stress protein 39 n=1 Tax=Iodobacter fluviatilis TaxID=537 RepID=A0A377SW64_9NEIS|nr:SDR family oxidoreductase [Iodobacter fluviatilis]TCU88135.1 NAD(P)-dependent dehydrogenase (short-subunit alcohol dehydrogenase family) [Iodobacter fluviatilis]STR45635.1 General stress protein 39 [Iodobacter fluviatilis]
MSKHTLAGKVVVIGGGAKNLGGLISRTLAAEGASIVVHYNSDSTAAAAAETVAAIEAMGGKAFAIQGDLSKAANCVALFDAAVKRFGGVDIAINTVGKVLKKAIVDVSEEEFDEMSSINSKAAFFFIREAGKHLNDNGKICTIVTSLLAAYTGYYSTYAGTKAAVEHFTRAAAKEFGTRGISVTAVGPGPMDTPFFYAQETPEAAAYLKASADLSAFNQSGLTEIEDIVPLIKFLVTEGWWVNGQTIFANGGFTTR